MTTMEADPNTSRVVESYLYRGKRAHGGVLTNRILVLVSRPGRARSNRAIGAEQRQSRSPRTRALVSNGTRRRFTNMHLNDVTQNDLRAPSMTEAS
jgi:hypothetical protein